MAAPFYLNTDKNVLRIAGGFAVQDVRRTVAALHALVHERGYSDVEIDLNRLTFAHAPSMLALITQVELYRRKGVDFSLALPNDSSLSRLCLNSNWAYFIDPNRFAESLYSPTKHNPVRRFSDAAAQNAVVNEVVDTLLKNLSDFERSHLQAIEWSLNEISDNVLVHAQSPIGGFIQVTAIRSRQRVEFVVADGGIGIAQSLRSTHRELSSDVDALSRAIEEGFTRDSSVGQGNGLFGSYQIALTSGGNFGIHANRSTLYYTESSGMHTRAEQVPFPGSMVVCGIDYTNPLVLERALRFKDRASHSPVDRLELHYETDERGEIVFKLREEAPSVGTRIAGSPIRQKITNLIRLTGAERVIVDFDDVHLISSSFADEVFGKLFIALGPIDFASRVQFKNCDSIVKKLIDKAIMQRATIGAPDTKDSE